MRLFASVIVMLLSPILAAAQDLRGDLLTQIEAYMHAPPESSAHVLVPPEAPVLIPASARENVRFGFQKRMAISGHGVLFDLEGNRVQLSDAEAMALQEELLVGVRDDQRLAETLPKGSAEELADLARKFYSLRRDETDAIRRAALRHLEIRARAWRLQDQARSDYLWRADYILNTHILRDRDFQTLKLSDDVLKRFQKLIEILTARRTAYMTECEGGGVPVPPDFATTGSPWTYQGDLTTNMLSPGDSAQVWTWAHSSRRGACVALPRGTGKPGDVAGIICEGAGSGNACFWDNIDRVTGATVAWAGTPLVLKKLQDGTMLALNCTGCHRGNNVYLVAPDDPTWCRLLRGGKPGISCAAPSGPNAGNLTLEVEGSVNLIHQPGTSLDHSSYVPMTGTPPRPGWTNTATASPACGGLCHLNSTGGFTPPSMPPACGTRCY